MNEQIARLIQRFPNRETIIKALARGNTHFRDLVSDHHEVARQLSSDEVAANPARRGDLQARQRNLEEELIRLIQGYPLV
jgi:hypothetical protein